MLPALVYLLVTVLGGALAVWLATRATVAVLGSIGAVDTARPEADGA